MSLQIDRIKAATEKDVEHYNGTFTVGFLQLLEHHIETQGLEAPDWKGGLASALCSGIEYADNTFAPGFAKQLEEFLHTINTDTDNLARREEAYTVFKPVAKEFQSTVDEHFGRFKALTDKGLSKEEAVELLTVDPVGKPLN